MKIAFVGKGGSGKSTIASLFTLYLLSKRIKLLAVDADLNIHLPSLLGLDIEEKDQLSSEENKQIIRQHLKGENKRIKDASDFVKTTPPGIGSNLISIDRNDFILKNFSRQIEPSGHFMFVGTYEEEAIGTSCYHSNLSILENILSHLTLDLNDWVVVDMVAGIDAFSNSLHLQFDQLVLIVEPTMESVQVFNQYQKLAQVSNVEDRLIVLGNKIEDASDVEFLKKHIGDKLLGCFEKNSTVKKMRQSGEKLSIDCLNTEDILLFDKLADLSLRNYQPEDIKLKDLHTLHKKFVKQEYIVQELGDLSDQIDPNFSFNS